MRRLAVMDMDGTLLEERTVDVLCRKFGLMTQLEEIDRQAEFLDAYEVNAAIALLFSGLKTKEIEHVFDGMKIIKGAREFVRFLKSNGFLTAIITDSYVFLASRLAEKLGIDLVKGNELEVIDGIVTGRISMPLGSGKQGYCRDKAVCKLHVMHDLAREYSVEHSETLAIGDSKTDLYMIQNAAIRVAFRPKDPEIIKAADIIIYTDFFELIRKLKEAQPAWRRR